jgi:hypothetical protein
MQQNQGSAMKYFLKYWFLFGIIIGIQPGFGQISEGGRPESFAGRQPAGVATMLLSAPDLERIMLEDEQSEKEGFPQRIAVAIPVNASTGESGTWEYHSELDVWRLRLECPGALAMNVNFDDFHLPEGARLFLYNDDKDFLLGAFTSRNNKPTGLFSTELTPGDAVTLELEVPRPFTGKVSLAISEVSYVYRFAPEFNEDKGTADDCEVNINCPEGENWQKHKRGVMRIYVRKGSAFFWCTGSLLNNTRMDRTPYVLTANHCAPSVTPDDLAQWIFYFNYEAPGCENPVSTPEGPTMTGATLLASANTTGSDFMLVLLDADVPDSYSPYYAGWDTENAPADEGVTIHHPAGDIKKISTYTEPLVSSQWGSTPNTHWQVFWTETVSGWGVTEGGSSGSPLFNENGMIVGTLTGGLAACDPGGCGPGTGPDKPDYYGKFSYSWDQNGTTPDKRLKDWLDPDNTGIKYLPGMNTVLTADFIAENRLIITGSGVTFTDLSSGPPASWSWHFEGGDPETFEGKHPPEVTYDKGGRYRVTLVVNDGALSDTLTRDHYIEVVGELFPNPTSGRVNIYLGDEAPALYTVEVFNALGLRIYEEKFEENTSRLSTVDLTGHSAGIYLVRMQVGQRYLFSKVLLINP